VVVTGRVGETAPPEPPPAQPANTAARARQSHPADFPTNDFTPITRIVAIHAHRGEAQTFSFFHFLVAAMSARSLQHNRVATRGWANAVASSKIHVRNRPWHSCNVLQPLSF
jgi:hypothetical protein